MLGGGEVEVKERKKLQKMHIPTYQDPARAARTLAALVRQV